MRKQSLDLPPSQNTLERELNNPQVFQPISPSKLDLFTSNLQLPQNLQLIADHHHRESVLSDDRNSYGLQNLINAALANNSINNGGFGNTSNQGFTPVRLGLNFMKANISANNGSLSRNRSLSLDHPKSEAKLPFDK